MASSDLQQRAIDAATAGSAVQLAECFANGVPLTRDIELAARNNPNPALNSVLLSNGWPHHLSIDFWMAADLGRGADLIRWYLDAGVQFYEEVYLQAAARGDLPTLQLLRERYGKSFAKSGALQAAAGAGKKDMVQWILQKGEEDINAWPKHDSYYDFRDCMNGAPLHRAVQFSHPSVVKLLLDNGANPNAIDQPGHTPLWYAQRQEGEVKDRIVELLQQAGATA